MPGTILVLHAYTLRLLRWGNRSSERRDCRETMKLSVKPAAPGSSFAAEEEGLCRVSGWERHHLLSEQRKRLENTLLFLTFSKVSGLSIKASSRDKRIKSIRRKRNIHKGNWLLFSFSLVNFSKNCFPWASLSPYKWFSNCSFASQENLRSRM